MREIQEFVEEYRATWEAIMQGEADVPALTRFFTLPCMMVGQDGTSTLYTEPGEILKFNRARCDAFALGGVRHAALRGVDVLSQGPHLCLAMVNWELTTDEGSQERTWRHYYTIHHSLPEPCILVSTFQSGS